VRAGIALGVLGLATIAGGIVSACTQLLGIESLRDGGVRDGGVLEEGGPPSGDAADGSTGRPDSGVTDSCATGCDAQCLDGASTQSVVLFGGCGNINSNFDCQDPLGDTWTWNGTSWTPQDEDAGPTPQARFGASIATLNGKAVLFGGCGAPDCLASAPLGDTWTWDGTNWTQNISEGDSGPRARYSASMATFGNIVVLFGGSVPSSSDGGTLVSLDDMWTWDGAVWMRQSIQTPNGRNSASMATLADVVVLFGGFGNSGSFLNDTWTWNGTGNWIMDETGPVSARSNALTATLGGDLFLFGGVEQPQFPPFDDTWTYTVAQPEWMHVDDVSPPFGYASAATLNSSTAVLFGGRNSDGGTLSDATWTWNGINTNWSQAEAGTAPPPRILAAMATVGCP
jgi:hypothetical protein